MTGPRSPRRRADDSRRTELITAARSVIAKEGVAAATTRRITQEAGLPHGTFHYWFSGKEELFEELIAEVIRELKEGVATVVSSVEGDSDASLRDHLRAAFDVVRRDEQVEPGRQLAMYELTALALRTPALRDMALRQYQAYRASATTVIDPWLAARDIDVPGGAEALGRLISVLFDGMVLAWLADPEGSDPDEVFTLIDTLVSSHRSASKGSNSG
ncbi:TetR/AcrR family transcriptional regulator [Streptomyces sp. NBC_00038]|uniref:TetR/AcrR family transcriptional regulator n=1 Tax=Streptomyces sp. NBC_00038 TaxID=2903615 RepID=UPI002251815F|nr:TetR family transcriptional regulator [Streptomyces sp. NBC_00038]MCX5554812.1 TetR family transcriptional regulator [Streptomyces sp. NBC_00038]